MQVQNDVNSKVPTGTGPGAANTQAHPDIRFEIPTAPAQGQPAAADVLPKEGEAAGAVAAAATNESISQAAVRQRLVMPQEQQQEVQAVLASLGGEEPAAISVQQQVTARLEALMKNGASGVQSHIGVDPAVYEKMAGDPAFAAKMESILTRLEAHPWFNEDIPGLKAQFVHIAEDGTCVLGFIREVAANEEEEAGIEMMLQSMLEELDDEMQKVWIERIGAASETSSEELSGMIEEQIEKYLALLRGEEEAAPLGDAAS